MVCLLSGTNRLLGSAFEGSRIVHRQQLPNPLLSVADKCQDQNSNNDGPSSPGVHLGDLIVMISCMVFDATPKHEQQFPPELNTFL